MQYVNRTFGLFDPTKPLVATRQMTLLGHEVTGGDLISDLKDANDVPIDSGVLRRLWMTRWADYKDDHRPTAELETHGEGREWMDLTEDGVAVTEGENGWYTITAPWLGEDGEKVHGAEAAEARVTEVRETGDTKGIEYAHSGGGWYTITGPGVPDGLKVKGEDTAKAKVKELRQPTNEPVLEPVEGHAALVIVSVEGEGEDAEHVVNAPWLEAPERFADADAAEVAQARDTGFEVLADETVIIANTPLMGQEITDSETGRTVKKADMLGHRKLQIETRLKILACWNPKKYGAKQIISGDQENPLKTETSFGVFDEMLKAMALERHNKTKGE